MTCFAIGHSTRSIEEFIALLRDASVTLVVDVRKLPGSRKYPHFNADALAESLSEAGIGYERSEGLTGRRRVSMIIPFEVNGFWRNRSFHNYADHALTEEFAAAIEELRTAASEQHVAVMCSEAVWWRCHRRIIADHLLAKGDQVIHLMDAGKQSPASLTEGAVIGEDGKVRYPAQADE
ncbi:DUF488 domain-containing protein [Gulosibacter chungangensis]|uniref:DUF488 domain-containing protein n=1 Tax=Gulosibacter chungangensis TaxID=979746 RepID=A0A7J5BFA6_9MICO|nr:DUF488 domain-containing protein [Gulosibacter chungangensis]KAB1644915.1 DUF488 domain-containing protein [Gulosibacter chungangensis]